MAAAAGGKRGKSEKSGKREKHGKTREGRRKDRAGRAPGAERRKENEDMIRRAEEKDVGEILRLLKQVNNVHAALRPDLFRMNERKYREEELKALLRDEMRPVFVFAGEGGTLKGHAFTVLEEHRGESNGTDRRTLYIDDICVDEGCRGQGVGTALFDRVIAFARETGCHNVTLNVWSGNTAAMKFYEAMGMKPYKVGMERVLE